MDIVWLIDLELTTFTSFPSPQGDKFCNKLLTTVFPSFLTPAKSSFHPSHSLLLFPSPLSFKVIWDAICSLIKVKEASSWQHLQSPACSTSHSLHSDNPLPRRGTIRTEKSEKHKENNKIYTQLLLLKFLEYVFIQRGWSWQCTIWGW